MSERAEAEFTAMQRRVRTATLLLVLLFASGVLGYKLVGGAQHTWLDAIYMATITLTTTGMRDVIPTNTPLAESFTIGYLLFGATAAVYTLSTITAFIVEGDLTKGFRRRRMQATIHVAARSIPCASADADARRLAASSITLVRVGLSARLERPG